MQYSLHLPKPFSILSRPTLLICLYLLVRTVATTPRGRSRREVVEARSWVDVDCPGSVVYCDSLAEAALVRSSVEGEVKRSCFVEAVVLAGHIRPGLGHTSMTVCSDHTGPDAGSWIGQAHGHYTLVLLAGVVLRLRIHTRQELDLAPDIVLLQNVRHNGRLVVVSYSVLAVEEQVCYCSSRSSCVVVVHHRKSCSGLASVRLVRARRVYGDNVSVTTRLSRGHW